MRELTNCRPLEFVLCLFIYQASVKTINLNHIYREAYTYIYTYICTHKAYFSMYITYVHSHNHVSPCKLIFIMIHFFCIFKDCRVCIFYLFNKIYRPDLLASLLSSHRKNGQVNSKGRVLVPIFLIRLVPTVALEKSTACSC